MYNLSYWFLKFIIYSFIGYSLEVIYCSFSQKRLVNRGFLFGPICPIYGLGGVILTFCLNNLKENPILVFILGMFITSTLEYFTSYIFEKIFHNKWWDYSNRVDNINGRICLQNSILFGLATIITIYLFEPILNGFLSLFTEKVTIILFILILILFLADLIVSIIIAYNLKSRLIVAEELKSAKLKLIPKLFEKKHYEVLSKIKFKQNRLIKNYPNLAKNLRSELNTVKKMVNDVRKK